LSHRRTLDPHDRSLDRGAGRAGAPPQNLFAAALARAVEQSGRGELAGDTWAGEALAPQRLAPGLAPSRPAHAEPLDRQQSTREQIAHG